MASVAEEKSGTRPLLKDETLDWLMSENKLERLEAVDLCQPLFGVHGEMQKPFSYPSLLLALSDGVL